MKSKQIHKTLKKYWNFDSFRSLQEEIILNILEGKDTLALLPTGGGKSICFQVPAMVSEGVCVVVSPLIALMKDQVQNLKARGIKAVALYSGMRKEAIDIALDNCIYGDTKFLYLSPERLSSPIFIERFKKMKVNFIAVDEAHCISQWGYDFRPAYLKISALRELKPKLAILALTATATPEVVIDIQEKLLFKENNLLQKSFLRSNLSYSVLYESAKLTKLIDILNKVKGSGIVYVQNRRQTREIAELLSNNHIKATYYHAGLSNELRDERQMLWINNKIRIIVATNAFGMGIDKSGVRIVVHLTLPDSLEAYFQEAGRAGRDGEKAYAVLLYNETDKLKKESILKDTMPSIEEIKNVYDALGNFFQLAIGSGKDRSFSFDISDFCGRTNLGVLKVHNALKFLEHDEYLVLSDAIFQPSKVYVKCSRKVLENFLEKQTKYKDLIKLMLRSYGGMFDNFSKIKEKYLANKLDTTIAKVKASLKYLEKQNLIIFEEQSDKPYIFFIEQRLKIEDLRLNTSSIKQRIKTFEKKHQEILLYAERKTICRSNALLQYFGELALETCGICDVCLGRNILKISDKQLDNISLQIKKEIKNKPKTLETIQINLKINNPEKLHQAIRFLMNNDFVQRHKDGLLVWNK